jgi:HTH-type transcriptional regulator/antitoxin HigA
MKHWLMIESKKEYDIALKRVEELIEMNPSTKSEAGREMKLLVHLVEQFEEENYPIDFPDPIEAIKVRMEDLGLQPKDLVDVIGDKGTVSKVLSRKIQLSLRMIRNLSKMLNLPADVLIQESKLETA